MSLAARRSTRQREDFVMRLGCFLVSFAVLASLILEPPRAKAFALTSSAVTALAGGFLNACGLAPVVSGMSSSGEVNESLARLLQDFLNEEVGGISVADWALSFGEIGLAVKDKKIVMPKPFAEKLGEFASWVAGKYGTKAGVNQVYVNSAGLFNLVSEGSRFSIYYPSEFIFYNKRSLSSGSLFMTQQILVPKGLHIIWCKTKQDISGAFFLVSDVWMNSGRPAAFKETDTEAWYLLEALSDENYLRVDFKWVGNSIEVFEGQSLPIESTYSWIKQADAVDTALALNVAETLTIPEGLTDNQSVALDVGATDSMSIQEILQGILDAILAGDLAASAEIVDEAVEPVDPPAEELPDVDGLGLPALGAALTSRFPFSIPWDVYKGVTLLAAPPKAPYFEVDFMAPIADRVGGWQGSTKIVLDFSEYEIIGQVCRWTSTIGFCLMLATGTKRLIWTA